MLLNLSLKSLLAYLIMNIMFVSLAMGATHSTPYYLGFSSGWGEQGRGTNNYAWQINTGYQMNSYWGAEIDFFQFNKAKDKDGFQRKTHALAGFIQLQYAFKQTSFGVFTKLGSSYVTLTKTKGPMKDKSKQWEPSGALGVAWYVTAECELSLQGTWLGGDAQNITFGVRTSF